MTSLHCQKVMDIKQMKNFVSQELRGQKQEHHLLSLRMFQLEEVVRGLGHELSLLSGHPCSSGK